MKPSRFSMRHLFTRCRCRRGSSERAFMPSTTWDVLTYMPTSPNRIERLQLNRSMSARRCRQAGGTARSRQTEAPALYLRLREHVRSIRQANNLEIEDFLCRFMILGDIESDLVVPVEAELIRRYSPLWNSVIDGFGNHDPGRGRYNQAKSEWDVLHPGRSWADRLTGDAPSVEEVVRKVEQSR